MSFNIYDSLDSTFITACEVAVPEPSMLVGPGLLQHLYVGGTDPLIHILGC
jgi:hypothetical protein